MPISLSAYPGPAVNFEAHAHFPLAATFQNQHQCKAFQNARVTASKQSPYLHLP